MQLKKDISIVVEGNSFELPPRTIKVAKMFDEFNQLKEDVKMHYKALEIIKFLLGGEAIEKIFGTQNIDEISTVDSILVLKAIDVEYMRPLNDENEEAFTKLKEVSASIDKIERVIK